VLKKPNINVIRYFIKVADLKNITNAAEEMYISQPTLSRQIISLESSLGVQLFNRVKTGVELTAGGEAFYVQCRKLIDAYDEFSAQVYKFKNIVFGTLNIGYQILSKEFILKYNTRVVKTFPNVTINNIRQSRDNFVDELILGKLDLAYIYGHELRNYDKNIKSIRVHSWRKMVMMSTENPLAKRDKIHISELKNEEFIQISRAVAPIKADEFFSACKSNGFYPNVIRYTDNFFNALIDVITYNAVSVMPFWNAPEAMHEKIKYVELDGIELEYPINLAWTTTNPNPVIPIYINQVKSALREKDQN